MTGRGSEKHDSERATNMNPKRLSHRSRRSVISHEHVGLNFSRMGKRLRLTHMKNLRIYPLASLQHGSN